MKLKPGDKYSHINPRNGKWVTCEVIKEEVYGYLKNDIYILDNLNGYAFKTNLDFEFPFIYAVDGVIYEYKDFLKISRKKKLERLLN